MRYNDIDDVIIGFPKFFSKSAMRGFNSRVGQTLYAGRYFVTSEKMDEGYPRNYTIREIVKGEGEYDYYLSNVGSQGQYSSSRAAIKAIEKLLQGEARSN